MVLSRFARVERRDTALSRFYSVGAWGKEPQRREERREKWEGEAAPATHLSVTDSQVTEIGLSLRPLRLGGLTGGPSIAWLRFNRREVGWRKLRFNLNSGPDSVVTGHLPFLRFVFGFSLADANCFTF